MEASLDLDADAFMMRLQWRPLTAGGWRAGRRRARIDEVQHESRPVLKDDGSRLSPDYGGWTARLGLVYALGD